MDREGEYTKETVIDADADDNSMIIKQKPALYAIQGIEERVERVEKMAFWRSRPLWLF
jgi:hypothetical protein